MSKIIKMIHESYKNDNKEDMEIMIPAGESVRVFYDQDRFSYEVHSTVEETQSVVLEPGMRMYQI